jgi:diguanylate cyclase (GGDEF)-like protein
MTGDPSAVAFEARLAAAGRALRESEDRLRAVIDCLDEAVFLELIDGSVELLNAPAKALAESDADSVTRSADWRFVGEDGEPIAAIDTPVGRSFAHDSPQRRVIGLDRPGHERVWLDVSARPLTRPSETAPYAVASAWSNVTERRDQEARLLDLADHDPLTGLWNRRRFEQDLAHQLDRCQRYGDRAALVLLDVDGFGQVNDELGQPAGDEVLSALGAALTTRLRSSDRAARLGGNEFAVLLLDIAADDEAVTRVATELAGGLRHAAGATDGRAIVSISVGRALLEQSSGDVNEALEVAGRAMRADRQARDGLHSSARALLAKVHAHGSDTAMPGQDVVELARAVAERLGLDHAQTSEIEHVALLHDVGNSSVPEEILRKAGPLTRHEQAVLLRQPVVGAEIVAASPELAHLAPAIRAEHERWDGGGYPDGLAGEQIPIASRITLVCNAYHAMTSGRPYRSAMSRIAAHDEIRREAGAQFCPRAATALLEVHFEEDLTAQAETTGRELVHLDD